MFGGSKWAKETARPQICYRYKAALLFAKYGIRLKFNEGAVNYSHKVWLKNRRLVADKDIKKFHKQIEVEFERLENSMEYVQLREGTASAILILDTLVRYSYVRKMWR